MMNLDELSEDAKFMFLSTMKCACIIKREGKSKEEFIGFCEGVWNSLEMNDLDEVEEIISQAMMKDIKEYEDDLAT